MTNFHEAIKALAGILSKNAELRGFWSKTDCRSKTTSHRLGMFQPPEDFECIHFPFKFKDTLGSNHFSSTRLNCFNVLQASLIDFSFTIYTSGDVNVSSFNIYTDYSIDEHHLEKFRCTVNALFLNN